MNYQDLLQYHLDCLEVPGVAYSLDRVRPYRDRTRNVQRPGFESRAACWAEDSRRAHALKALPKELYEGIFHCDLQEILKLLEFAKEIKQMQSQPASAVYMRGRRLALFGCILKLIRDHVSDDLGFFRVTHPTWRFGLREQWFPPAMEEETSFEHLMRLVQLWDFPGFMVACLSGIYDEEADKIELAWSGVCGGIMLRAMKILLTVQEHHYSDFNICIDSVADLAQQLLEIMPNRIDEGRYASNGVLEPIRRMREPHHSVYLLWLSQFKLSERLILVGVTLDPDKGLVLHK